MLNNFKIQELAWKANLHHLNTDSCSKFAELVIAENKRQESDKMTGRSLSDYKKGTRVKILYGILEGVSGTIVDDRWMWNYDKDSNYWALFVRMDGTGYEYKFNVNSLEIIEEETTMKETTVNNMTLRDQFAAEVLPAIYEAYVKECEHAGCQYENWRCDLALDAYRLADAMLEAREVKL